MNKIILNFGLLVFFISMIIFSQKGWMIEQVLLKSFIVFVVITVMFSILAIVFVKSINKTTFEKSKNSNQNLMGSNRDE